MRYIKVQGPSKAASCADTQCSSGVNIHHISYMPLVHLQIAENTQYTLEILTIFVLIAFTEQ